MERQPPLFDEPHQGKSGSLLPPLLPGQLRLTRADRQQVRLVLLSLDELLPKDHPARSVWAFLDQANQSGALAGFYRKVQAAVEGPGRPATDPQVVLALWIFATSEGVGSARELERLTQEHQAYQWLRGGVPLNYHLLSDFRVSHEEELNYLLTKILAVLMEGGLVALRRVAQDGVRVRANAGSGSFPGGAGLAVCLKEAREQVERLAKEREHPDPGLGKRRARAEERAAREREARVRGALEAWETIEKERKVSREKPGGRASTTDPEARIMHMPDGGYRPGHNLHLAVDTDSQVVLGVMATNHRTDVGVAPLVEQQITERLGKAPECYLMDGGFVRYADIIALEQRGVSVYAPPLSSQLGRRRAEARTPEVGAWWERMETPEGQRIYKERVKTECINALLRERYGLRRLLVRGLGKVACVLLLVAVTHDILRYMTLTLQAHPAPRVA